MGRHKLPQGTARHRHLRISVEDQLILLDSMDSAIDLAEEFGSEEDNLKLTKMYNLYERINKVY